MRDYSALVTLEALSHFPYQPRSIEDVILEDSSIPSIVELAGGTTGGISFSFSLLLSSFF